MEYCGVCQQQVGTTSSGPYKITEKDGKSYLVEHFQCLQCFVTISSKKTFIPDINKEKNNGKRHTGMSRHSS